MDWPALDEGWPLPPEDEPAIRYAETRRWATRWSRSLWAGLALTLLLWMESAGFEGRPVVGSILDASAVGCGIAVVYGSTWYLAIRWRLRHPWRPVHVRCGRHHLPWWMATFSNTHDPYAIRVEGLTYYIPQSPLPSQRLVFGTTRRRLLLVAGEPSGRLAVAPPSGSPVFSAVPLRSGEKRVTWYTRRQPPPYEVTVPRPPRRRR